MSGYTKSLGNLMEELVKLPGVGKRSAERLAFHLLRVSTGDAMALARAIRDLKKNTRLCSKCFNIADSDPCGICSDSRRDRTMLCVIEQTRDLIAIEEAGSYSGLYHVLQGRIAPLEGMTPESLTISQLLDRVKVGGVKEVILATNPDMEGDVTANYIAEQLGRTGVRITRPARGLPAGSQVEYVGKKIISDAFESRQQIPPGNG